MVYKKLAGLNTDSVGKSSIQCDAKLVPIFVAETFLSRCFFQNTEIGRKCCRNLYFENRIFESQFSYELITKSQN